ncbi:hypothetical protein KIPB_003929 [Kipferlia bialata]|uniref:Flavodoxin-like domain-containing protein n=1 Tax=Kipferlia bialata TaxID=797122 RepID=A0A9K3GH20_9EUKA|nr:hypothetical protein KIPB_003929 [Kipferlia bialata]|eukprot:g3929.t1
MSTYSTSSSYSPPSPPSAALSDVLTAAPLSVSVYIVYDSDTGYTEALAHSMAETVREEGERLSQLVPGLSLSLTIATVAEADPDAFISVAEADPEAFISSDLVFLGSPVWNGSPKVSVLEFLARCPFSGRPREFMAVSFATGSAFVGGLEHTLATLDRSLSVFGGVPVGGSFRQALGVGAVTKDGVYSGYVDPVFLRHGASLASRALTLTVQQVLGKAVLAQHTS